MINNISFGTLHIGGRNDVQNTETKTAINRFCQNDIEVAKKLGDFCNKVNEETGEDSFTLRAADSRGTGIFEMYYSSPHQVKSSDGTMKEKMRDTRVFYSAIRLNDDKEKKCDFIDKLTGLFTESLNSDTYLITQMTNKHNRKNKDAGIIIQNSSGRYANLKSAIAWDGNKELIAEFDSMLEDISKVLHSKNKKAYLTATRTFRYDGEFISLSIKCDELPPRTGNVLIKKNASKEERHKAINELKSDVMYYLCDKDEPVPEIAPVYLNYTDKTDMPELNAIFDKYC